MSDINSRQTEDAAKVKGPSSGRAVASDFDNTLYFMGDEEPMRAADIFGILYYQQRGGLFGLCTGRSLVGVREVIGPWIRPDFYILASGALVVDGEENVLFRKCLSLDIVESIYQRCTGDLRAVIQANDTVYTFGEENYLQTHIDSLEELRDGHVYGLSIAAPDEKTAAKVTAEINKDFGKEVTAFHNVTHIDIGPIGCSKGSGIEVIRKAFSVQEMYGIGDSYNDLPLLESVDHPYTLDHAPQKVKDAAEGIIRGVSELLDRI
ncbi:MAG: HAD family phosphatase [Lachnospiraceae bacterium]|jgi:HAD superfamily hydrolase (TIGR01484 family)|nr:HAD family phosphatase [Lachnospiraceae bacterium]